MGIFEQMPYTNYHDLNLDWILKAVKEALEEMGVGSTKIEELTNKVTAQENNIKSLQVLSDELKKELDDVENGKYVPLYLNSIINWIDENLQQLVARIVKFVTFEIDDSGYFIAIIPDNWDFLKFDTIMDTTSENYGHLVLEF